MPALFSEEDLVSGTLPGPPLCDSGPAAKAGGGGVIRVSGPLGAHLALLTILRKYMLLFFPLNRSGA